MARSAPAITLSVRVPVESYLATQAWQVDAIQKAVEKADSKDARFIEHDKVIDWLMSWGTDNEKDRPL